VSLPREANGVADHAPRVRVGRRSNARTTDDQECACKSGQSYGITTDNRCHPFPMSPIIGTNSRSAVVHRVVPNSRRNAPFFFRVTRAGRYAWRVNKRKRRRVDSKEDAPADVMAENLKLARAAAFAEAADGLECELEHEELLSFLHWSFGSEVPREIRSAAAAKYWQIRGRSALLDGLAGIKAATEVRVAERVEDHVRARVREARDRNDAFPAWELFGLSLLRARAVEASNISGISEVAKWIQSDFNFEQLLRGMPFFHAAKALADAKGDDAPSMLSDRAHGVGKAIWADLEFRRESSTEAKMIGLALKADARRRQGVRELKAPRHAPPDNVRMAFRLAINRQFLLTGLKESTATDLACIALTWGFYEPPAGGKEAQTTLMDFVGRYAKRWGDRIRLARRASPRK
jgi:hypothetical protein